MFSIPLPDPLSELLPLKNKMKIKTDKQNNQNKIKKSTTTTPKTKENMEFILCWSTTIQGP